MRTIVAISLSFLIFFQSMGFGISDVFMLKGLVEHAKYHSEEFGDDFFTFVQKHYGDLKTEHHKTQENEQSQHEKLPFQHHNCNHLLVEGIVTGYHFPIEDTIVIYTSNSHYYYLDLYSFLEKTSIFQPPQFA